MFSTQTVLEAYFLPDDREEALQALIDFVDSARPGEVYRQIMYGFTRRELVDAILRAHERGVECKLILDYSQSRGKAEAQQLHRMLLAGFPASNVRIGTSTEHQILHMKVAFIVPDGGVDAVPDARGGQFRSIVEARQAGYPCLFEGSTNWSATGFSQANTLNGFPSKPYAAKMLEWFETQWQWLTDEEPEYQLGA